MFHEAMLVHPDKVKDIVLVCVVQRMLRAQKGAGGRAERDLEDEEITCDLEDGYSGDGHGMAV